MRIPEDQDLDDNRHLYIPFQHGIVII